MHTSAHIRERSREIPTPRQKKKNSLGPAPVPMTNSIPTKRMGKSPTVTSPSRWRSKSALTPCHAWGTTLFLRRHLGARGRIGSRARERHRVAHAGPWARASRRRRRRRVRRLRCHGNGGLPHSPRFPGAGAPGLAGRGGVARRQAAGVRLRGAVSRLPPFTYFSLAEMEVGRVKRGRGVARGGPGFQGPLSFAVVPSGST